MSVLGDLLLRRIDRDEFVRRVNAERRLNGLPPMGPTASGKLDGEPEGPDTTRTTERPVQPRLPDADPAPLGGEDRWALGVALSVVESMLAKQYGPEGDPWNHWRYVRGCLETEEPPTEAGGEGRPTPSSGTARSSPDSMDFAPYEHKIPRETWAKIKLRIQAEVLAPYVGPRIEPGDPDGWIVFDDEVCIAAHGPTPADAWRSYRDSLVARAAYLSEREP